MKQVYAVQLIPLCVIMGSESFISETESIYFPIQIFFNLET